jgi:hypothetical protein
MNYPSKESVELGLRMVSVDLTDTSAIEEALKEQVEFSEECSKNQLFMGLCNMLHLTLTHTPIAKSCELQEEALANVMMTIFHAGWLAGRQEVMDAEVERMGKV